MQHKEEAALAGAAKDDASSLPKSSESVADTAAEVQSTKATAAQLLSLLHDGYAEDIVFTIAPTGGVPNGHRLTHATLTQWIEQQSGALNCYFSPAMHKPGADRKKFSEKDMVGTNALWVDIDPNGGAEFESSRATTLEALLNYKLPPSVIVDSGNGYQAFWLLKDSQGVLNPVEFQAVKLRNKKLAYSFERSDKTFSLDHLMRLPDAVNVLTEKKVKKGYPPGNRLARIVLWEPQRRYDLHQFEPAEPEKPTAAKTTASAALPGVLPTVDLDTLDLSALGDEAADALRRVIKDGPSADEFGGDRSNAVFHVCCALIRADVPETAIVAILLDKRFRISDHLYESHPSDTRKYAERQLRVA